MQKAVITDQGIIKDDNGTIIEYSDHEEIEVDKAAERVALMIADATTPEELNKLRPSIQEGQEDLFAEKMEILNAAAEKTKQGKK